VEVEYLRALAEEGFVDLEPGALTYLRGLAEGFGPEEAEEVKSIEAEVGHDVEAIVRFLKSRLRSNGFFRSSVWVHAGLTSEDVNSTAFSLSLKAVNESVLVPELEGFCAELAEVAWRERATPMLARTHGRPAVPTTLGRELAYHAMRTLEWIERLRGFRMPGKLSGAIGSYAGLRELPRREDPRVRREVPEVSGPGTSPGDEAGPACRQVLDLPPPPRLPLDGPHRPREGPVAALDARIRGAEADEGGVLDDAPEAEPG